MAYLRDERHIGAIKLPERLLLLEALPRSPNNKVVKSVLRAQAAGAAHDVTGARRNFERHDGAGAA